MGVDPGLVDTGFGVLEAGPGGLAVVDAGVVSSAAGQSLEARLNAIHGAVRRLIEAREPGLLVVEDLYTEYRFPRTAILMGHARGVIYLAARQCGVSVLALAASEVKRAVTGNGAAGKGQMQRGVQTLLGLAELPRPSHVADALGLALTGMSRITGRAPFERPHRLPQLLGEPEPQARRADTWLGEPEPQARRADTWLGEPEPQARRADT